MIRRILRYALIALLAALLILILFVLSREPRSDREWLLELSRDTIAITHPDGQVSLTNVRDWTYGIGEVKTTEWLPEVFVDPNDIIRVWFVLEPFDAWEAVGHTYLTFEFSDGSAYSFSVEARREADEDYSPLLGLFREYELSYTWGTERDFLTRRLLYLSHPVRMYPMNIEKDAAKMLFLKLAEKTSEVSKSPRFYHTLTANCTNVLAELANESSPGALPYDISWNLPGYSDGYLMQVSYISTLGTKEETKAIFDLTPYREEVSAIAELPSAEFGRVLRMLPPFQNVPESDITP